MSQVSYSDGIFVWEVRGLEQVQHSCSLNRLKAAVSIEFAVDILDMVPNRTHRYNQVAGDLLRGQPRGNQAEDLAFAPAEGFDEQLAHR